MNSRRLLIISIATGVLGVVMLNWYMNRFERKALGGDPVEILIAIQDIPTGTALTAEMLGVRAVPSMYVEERHVERENQARILGVRITSEVKANEALLWTDFSSGVGSRRIRDFLQPGTRGVTIPVDAGSAPLLSPGSRIDLSLTTPVAGQLQTMMLMQNLIVIAVGGRSDPEARGSNMVTVAVSPRQASFLTIASQTGRLTALLRNNVDLSQPDVAPVPQSSVIEREKIREVIRRVPASQRRDGPPRPVGQ